MPDDFDQIKEHAAELTAANAKRNLLFDEMDKLYWMEWDEEGRVAEQIENVKITRSPLARNSIIGAMRLLTATDPEIDVPHDINNPMAEQQSSKIEKFCKAMWFASGREAGDPLHNDAVRSALLYSEVVIAINSTKEMLKMATNPIMKNRMEDINKRTPYLFEIWSPHGCNSEREKFGLTSFHRKVNTTAGHIEDVYGEEGKKALLSGKYKKVFKRSDNIVLNTLYDLKYYAAWMDGFKEPIKLEEHNLPFIPIVDQTVEGSGLFKGKPYYTQEPFLYTLFKTRLVDRQSLMLTVLYTMLFSIGANPMFVEYLNDPGTHPNGDYTEPGGVLRYRLNERREVMAKQVIDPALLQGWNISSELEGQSTIYKQTLGEPIGGGNAPYSAVALLSQSGRLPLQPTQQKVGWAIGEAQEIAVRWMKKDNQSGTANYASISQTLTPDDIPDVVNIDVQLEIHLPTDKLQAANVANMLAQGENPMVSQQWVRKNILDIGQTEDMTREIWSEKAANIHYLKFIYQQLADLEQAKQAAMQPGNASGLPGMPGNQPPMAPSPQMPNQQVMPQSGTPPQPAGPQRPVEPMPPEQPLPPQLANQIPR